jgi:hypothetical protein
MAGIEYRPEQIRKGLQVLVIEEGNSRAAARWLADNSDIRPDRTTLERWRQEYSEVYDELERKKAQVEEDEIVAMLRSRVHRAIEIEDKLLNIVADTKHVKDAAQALRAVSDVKGKGIDSLLKMTGRSPEGGQSENLETIMGQMVAGGYASMTVSLEKQPPKKVDAEATTE